MYGCLSACSTSGICSRSIVNIAIVSRVGVPARRRAVLPMAVLTMPLSLPTMCLLDVRPLLGVEVHEPLHQVDRLDTHGYCLGTYGYSRAALQI